MKKTIMTSMAVAALAAGISLYSCKKEVATGPKNPASGVSVYENENGKFKKEIVVTDESGKNSLYLAISSDYQSTIDNYLKNTELKLIIEKEEVIARLKEQASVSNKLIDDKSTETPTPKVKKENSVLIDVVTSNFEKDVKGYSLLFKMAPPAVDPKNPSVNYQQGALTELISSSDFCGVVNLGWGLDIMTILAWKNNSLSSYQNEGGVVYLSGSSNVPANYARFIYKSGSYRTRALVWKDLNQGAINFKIVFETYDYRGHNCTIGTYDGTDCYYGTPPSGTNAFIWSVPYGGFPPTLQHHFYYTPVSGNQCPMPGSGFDGSNCHVLAVPLNCSPFIWSNRWYVRPDPL